MAATPPPRIKVYLLSPPPASPYYQAQWEDANGVRRTRSLKTTDAGEGDTRRADLEFRLNNGMPVDPPKRGAAATWAAFRERYMAEHGGGPRERSREKTATVFDAVERLVGPSRVADLDDDAMRRFVRAMSAKPIPGGKVGLAPSTQHSYLTCLGTALRWAAEAGIVDRAPRMPKVKVPRRRPIPADAGDIQKLLDSVGPDWRLFFQFALWAGLRLSEAHQLRWARDEHFPWVDLPGRRAWIPCTFAKGVEDQWVPLHPELVAGLESLPRVHGDRVFRFCSSARHRGRELTRNGLSSTVIYMAKKAGVKLSMQRLRKAFGCGLASKVPAAVLQKLMRHSSITTTMTFYATAEDASLRDAIDGQRTTGPLNNSLNSRGESAPKKRPRKET